MSKLGVWIRPKSNGIYISRKAFRLIRAANIARGLADWPQAAHLFHRALEIEPALAHIWIQFGHAAKESGKYDDAAGAYERAAELDPQDPEPHLFLGHMAKRSGSGSAHHYLRALRRAPDSLSAAGEVMQAILLGRQRSDNAFLEEALDLLNINRSSVAPYQPPRRLSEHDVFFDVSDLLSYFSYSRIPSGVQRVQIEVMLGLLSNAAGIHVQLCCYSAGRQCWNLLSPSRFTDLCVASLEESASRRGLWQSELRLIYVSSALSEEIIFPGGSVLLSFSASSPDRNYLLDVRTVCERDGVSYVPLMYDLIPMLNPDWVVPAHFVDFSAWLHSMLRTAQGYITISEATRRDILTLAKRQNVEVDADMVRVVSLDGEFSKADHNPLSVDELIKWGLSSNKYVLFVSTIEPRKNHIGAFKAWLALASELGSKTVPTLVCVGGRGWLNDPIHAFRAEHSLLRKKVLILSDVPDLELDLLYRHCAFTIYPSLYEGWGLPVTESLCYAKVPAISKTSSLPEAGGDFAVYFDPYDIHNIVQVLKPLIIDIAYRRSLEWRISEGFTPRSWKIVGLNLVTEAQALAERLRKVAWKAPIAAPNTFYRLSAFDGLDRPHELPGEIFRHGRGWYAPAEIGCRVTEDGAVLRLSMAQPELNPLKLELTLAAVNGKTSFLVKMDATSIRGHVDANCTATISFTIGALDRESAIHIKPTEQEPLYVVGFEIVPDLRARA